MNRRLSDQFQLRLPEGMRKRIRLAAERNDRSMNAEIVATLNEAYPPTASLTEMSDQIRGILREYRVDLEHRHLASLVDVIQEVAFELDSLRAVQNAPEDQDPDA